MFCSTPIPNSSSGNVVVLHKALEAGAEVNAVDYDGWSSLMHAVNNGHIKCAQLLLSAGADPDSAFVAAILKGRKSMIKLLLARGASPEQGGEKNGAGVAQ